MKKSEIIEVGAIRVLVVVLQLIFLKVYTNYTSVYELGIYYFLFTISYSLNAFLLVPLDYFQQSKIYKLKENKISLRSFNSINTWVIKITGVFLLLSLVVCYFINPGWVKLIPIISLLALSTYLVNLLRGFVNNLEKRRIVVYTLLIEGVLKIAFYLLFKTYFQSSAFLILGALLSSSVVAFVILISLLRKMPEFKFSKIDTFKSKEIIAFSYPISIGAVINWIQLQGYRMILVPLGLVEIVGLYGTIANVGTSGMNAFSVIYSQLFTPNLYKTNGNYIKIYLRNAVMAIIGILLISYFFSDLIVGVLTKMDFVRYSPLIIYGIISEAGNLLIGGLTVYLTIKNATKVTIKASMTGLIVFILSFGLLYLLNNINVYTIGLPIILTQMIITIYLLFIVYKLRNAHNER